MVFLAKPWINRTIRKRLSERHSSEFIEELIWNSWWSYDRLRTSIDRETTLGGRIMVELAVLSEAFYTELLRRVRSKNEAIELFNSIAWGVYEMMGRLTWAFTGVGAKGNHDRLRKAIMAFRKFPFSSPSYRWRDIPAKENEVRFNCERCPVAEYFKGRGLADVGYRTWCQYDYRMAELWGGRLELTNTIAGGGDVCDFKWISK